MNLKPVLFFDGVCGLCSFAVDFVMKYDKQGVFLFSPLQSEYAQKHLSQDLTKCLSTLVLQDQEGVYTKSDAVLKILVGLGGIWKVAFVGYLIPLFFRNTLYDFVAQNRYRWFGKKETCRLPTPEERQRFLL